MTDLKKMTVAASGKLRQVAYDILNEQTRLLSWQQGGKVPQEQFDSWLAEAEGLYSIGNIKVDEAFLAKAPKLKVIAQASVGYDNIDIAACSAHGIAVGNTPGVLVDAVADLAYGLILDSARSIPVAGGTLKAANGANGRVLASALIWLEKLWELSGWVTLAVP